MEVLSWGKNSQDRRTTTLESLGVLRNAAVRHYLSIHGGLHVAPARGDGSSKMISGRDRSETSLPIVAWTICRSFIADCCKTKFRAPAFSHYPQSASRLRRRQLPHRASSTVRSAIAHHGPSQFLAEAVIDEENIFGSPPNTPSSCGVSGWSSSCSRKLRSQRGPAPDPLLCRSHASLLQV